MSNTPSTTRTGNFPIGFRRGGSGWQKNLDELLSWAKENEFGALDIGRDGNTTASSVRKAGLRIGSADLKQWQEMISPDANTRSEAVRANADYVRAATAQGVQNFFCVMLPQQPNLPRPENFGYMVENFGKLAPALEEADARLVIEGWPGAGALCCTPADLRAFFDAVPSPSMSLNYDPSHLIRMGIDPLRFLAEFVGRIRHVHGKDTELLSEGLYLHGHEQRATFDKPMAYGGASWRYTLPGHGVMRWVEAFKMLEGAGYDGCVCVELEDARFNGSEDGEKAGLLASRQFLQSC